MQMESVPSIGVPSMSWPLTVAVDSPSVQLSGALQLAQGLSLAVLVPNREYDSGVSARATDSTRRALGRTLRVWVLTWAVGGALAGGVLALGEPGHVPRPLIPPLLAAIGAVSGLAAGALDRLLSPLAGGSPAAAAVLAMVSGLVVGLALWRFGLGTPPCKWTWPEASRRA